MPACYTVHNGQVSCGETKGRPGRKRAQMRYEVSVIRVLQGKKKNGTGPRLAQVNNTLSPSVLHILNQNEEKNVS